MGQYLLCGVIAVRPFEVEELGLRLYTAEELCYYIYHNLSFIEDGFIDERLLTFIKVDIKLPELAEKIRRYYQNLSDQDGILVMILRDVGYYSDIEILKFQEQLAHMRKQNPLEKSRDKADLLFEKKKYKSALKVYQNILAVPRDSRLKSGFYVLVLQHMASAYMQLLLYEEAMACYQAACLESQDIKVLEQMYYACMLGGMELPQVLETVSPEQMDEWHCRYLASENETGMKIETGPVTLMYAMDSIKRGEEMKAYMSRLKKDYLNMEMI